MENVFVGSMFMLIFYWGILSLIVCVGMGAERTCGWFGSLLICLFFSPFIGLICTLLFPTKADDARAKKLFAMQEEFYTKMGKQAE